MGKTKAIVDTNILISALGWKGNPRKEFEYPLVLLFVVCRQPNQWRRKTLAENPEWELHPPDFPGNQL